MKLSICVITMNRAAQLKEALESCLACELPSDTEFVVIDNASTDNTEQIVRDTLDNCGYSYYYEKMSENLGCGGGRNYAYGKACGEYAYMLDDDAVIDTEKNPDFFVRGLAVMEENPDIVTLTTQIYDTVWERNHLEATGQALADGLYRCFMFCGGSHYLRRSFYAESPYVPNKYGYEEIPPSLFAFDAGKINAFFTEVRIIHKPAINKWDYNDEKNHALLVKGIAIPYAIKKMMYPLVFRPILSLAHIRRISSYMAHVPNAKSRVNEAVKNFSKEYPIKEKIKISTVLRMVKDFKLSAF